MSDFKCNKCGGEMGHGIALKECYAHIPAHNTRNRWNANVKSVNCIKCKECGHSVENKIADLGERTLGKRELMQLFEQ